MKNKTSLLLPLILAMSLSACASSGVNHTPIIDGPKTAQYEADLNECRTLVKQGGLVDDDAKTGIAVGAAFGALSGASNRRYSRRRSGNNVLASAIVGALIGGVAGTYNGHKKEEYVLLNCMAGRGYRVLG